jgi:hypothetical protein
MSKRTGQYVVTLDKHRATWNYFTTNPEGGGLGSTYCGPKRIALKKAIEYLPVGTPYILIVNGKETREVR